MFQRQCCHVFLCCHLCYSSTICNSKGESLKEDTAKNTLCLMNSYSWRLILDSAELSNILSIRLFTYSYSLLSPLPLLTEPLLQSSLHLMSLQYWSFILFRLWLTNRRKEDLWVRGKKKWSNIMNIEHVNPCVTFYSFLFLLCLDCISKISALDSFNGDGPFAVAEYCCYNDVPWHKKFVGMIFLL